MDIVAVLMVAGVVGSMAGYAYGYVTGRCSKENPCPKCGYHVNEQRVERLAAEQARVEEAKKQAELRHDVAHKGFGWATGAPDKYNCHEDACSRNVEGRQHYSGTGLQD